MLAPFLRLPLFARNFLPAHSCVITGSATGRRGRCHARWTDGDGLRGLVSAAAPPHESHEPRQSSVGRSVCRCATFLPPVKSD